MISEERRELLLWYWENERYPEDEEWRDELTEEERELVDRWDGRYYTGLAKLANRQKGKQ